HRRRVAHGQACTGQADEARPDPRRGGRRPGDRGDRRDLEPAARPTLVPRHSRHSGDSAMLDRWQNPCVARDSWRPARARLTSVLSFGKPFSTLTGVMKLGARTWHPENEEAGP